MATQFAPTLQPSAPVPFLLGGARDGARRASLPKAVKSAVAAVNARGELGNPRQQVALFLWELSKACGGTSDFPLSRAALADALHLSLVRVKRTLALLSLSGIISCDSEQIKVLNWRKLSGAAGLDPAALHLEDADEDEERAAWADDEVQFFTASGEPACFV